VVELKNEKSKLNDIEGTINKMMKKIKKIKDKSEKSIINTSSNQLSESKFKEESFLQKTDILNQQITDVYRHNNTKIDNLNENLESFKKIIANQIDELAKKNTLTNNRTSNTLKDQIDYNREDTKRSDFQTFQPQAIENIEIIKKVEEKVL